MHTALKKAFNRSMHDLVLIAVLQILDKWQAGPSRTRDKVNKSGTVPDDPGQLEAMPPFSTAGSYLYPYLSPNVYPEYQTCL